MSYPAIRENKTLRLFELPSAELWEFNNPAYEKNNNKKNRINNTIFQKPSLLLGKAYTYSKWKQYV